MGEYTDCPVFDGLYDYCKLYTGGSIGAAAHLALFSSAYLTISTSDLIF